MARSRLVDRFGRPIEYNILGEELAAPQLIGVRQAWHQTVSNDLTPERMAAILEASKDTTNPREYLYLAEEMEEKDTHYFAVLEQRKLAVDSIVATVEAASDDRNDQRIADAVREVMALDCIASSRFDLLDGLGKSFSVAEIIWDRSENQWQPRCVEWRDPTWFLFDLVDRSTLRLRDLDDPALGVPLAPFKFIVHKPRIKTGIPIRNGLARLVAFVWICKQYMLKDWMAFAEVFGMPIRIGRYPSSATPRDVSVLRSAVANIGSDAACVIPHSMEIELEQTGSIAGAADLFEKGCAYLDRQISKAVVGQTSTMDAEHHGMNSRGADVHNEVRGDIRDADCTALEQTYNRDLIKPFVDLNFGPQKHYPRLRIRKPAQQDLALLSKSLSELVPLGLRVEAGEVRDKFGFTDPDPDTEVLGPPPAVEQGKVALNRRTDTPARNAMQDQDVVDGQTDRLGQMADASLQSMYGRIRALMDQMIEQDRPLSDFRDALMNLTPELDADGFAQAMQMGLTAARLAGRYDILEEAGVHHG